MLKTLLITGGTGFLGVHIARRAIKDGYKVILLDIAPLDAKDLFGKVTVIKADIRNKTAVLKALKNQTYIVHAAAALPIQKTKEAIFSTNIDGTKNVLEAALKNNAKRLIFISTTAVYGVPQHLPEKEDSPLDPIGYYGESKVAGENFCKEYMKKGLQVTIFRPKTFLGPERLGVFELWFEAIYTGKRVFLLGNGNNPYQLLAVSDFVDAIMKALIAKITNTTLNVGARDFTTWKKDITYVVHYAKSKSIITGLPVIPSQILLGILEALNMSPIAAWHYKTMPVASYVATEKAQKILNWRSKKSNQELLLENYKWYEKNHDTIINAVGMTHRVGWNFKILRLVSRFF